MSYKNLITTILTTSLLFTSCATMTQTQEEWYARYVLDPHKPQLDKESKSVVGATLLSILMPGLGEMYLNIPQWAPLWYFVGLVLPFTAPVAAAVDAQTVNKILLGEQYRQYIQEKELQQKGKEEKRTTCSFCGLTGNNTDIFCSGCGHRLK